MNTEPSDVHELVFRRFLELADAKLRILPNTVLDFGGHESPNDVIPFLREAGVWSCDLGGKYQVQFNGDEDGPLYERDERDQQDFVAVVQPGEGLIRFRDHIAARFGQGGDLFAGTLVDADRVVRLFELELDRLGYNYQEWHF